MESDKEFKVTWSAQFGEYRIYRGNNSMFPLATVSYPIWIFRKLGHTLEGNIEKAICKIREDDRKDAENAKFVAETEQLVNDIAERTTCP